MYKSSYRAGVALLLAALLVTAGCETETTDGTQKAGPDEYPYTIVTTAGMVTDIVEQVAGDKANVVGLMGEGVDPHLYKPTRNDVMQLSEADVVFYIGLMLEGRMADTFTKIARGGKPVYRVTEGLDESFLLEPPGFGGHWDPHVWMDVSAWSQAVAAVAEALADYDPANATYYHSNAEAYQKKLARLHDYVREVIATIPEQQRVLVTAHDAFGYFSRAYDVPVRSAQGISTESEAGVDDINQLVDFIVANKIGAIFVESTVSEKNMRAIIEGAKQKGWDVQVGGELYSDAMGAPGTYEGTYIGMLDHNATTIARALGGNPPSGGFRAQLAE